MSDYIPGSVGEAFANLSLNFDGLRQSFIRHTRYLAADMHRNRLIRSGQYIKTSSRKARR